MKRLYSTNELSASLTEERLSNFERSGDNDLRKIPMSRPGLVEHTKRSCYQAGYLWRECIENVTLPDPVLWGWCRKNGKLVPKWQEGETVDILPVISTCTCKTKSCKNCKCAKVNIVCLPFCSCRRSCGNI